jgi:tetratricopeptide (TPR) repeat protein
LLPVLGLALGAPAARATPGIEGDYDSPLGRVHISTDAAGYRGRLAVPSALCAFQPGDEVLRATLLDDSLAGEMRVCLSGKTCRRKEAWGSAVLLAGDGKLSGAIHVSERGCVGPFGRTGGVTLARVSSSPPPAPVAASAGARRERARALLRDGKGFLDEGAFEQARRRFLEAIEADPGVPEAYNGVGVTWRMRNDLGEALRWYKKALAVDPDFGDAYYNMACVYALQGRRELALRYLEIAALNGYATAEGIDADPDLEPLRGLARYRALREGL